jgi:cytochrome c-type biogenesis protein
MIDAPIALAFTTGMIVTVNPCGFAMLPAYLSFFVGEDERGPSAQLVARALVVGPTVTAGFVTAFAVLGLLVAQVTSNVYEVTPWLSLVIGGLLVVLGLAFLFGFEARLRLPRLDRGGTQRSLLSMALFGVSYAVASVGCTLPLFIATMTGNFGRGLPSGIAYFAAYAAGFGLVITTLTVAIALAQGSLVRSVRSVLPFVHRIAGGLLVLTGLYIAHYGWVEIQQGRSQSIPQSPFVDRVTDWSSQAQTWILDRRDLVSLVFFAFLVSVVTGLLVFRSPRTAQAKSTTSV